MKHWTYIGITLIVANASFLQHVRAAELSPGNPHRPLFGITRLSMRGLWTTTPQPEIHSPVTVRLFAGRKVRILWLKNSAGFMVSDRAFKGPLFISVQDQKLSVYLDGKWKMSGKRLDVHSLDDRVYGIRTRAGVSKMTRGELHLSIAKGHLLIVNRLGLEDYVSGIVEGELGSIHVSREAMKAQIVAARSYVLSMRGQQHHGEGYDFCDEPHCQVYSGIPAQGTPGFEVALAQVHGQYLSYKGRPIAAFYHHNCGGMTSAVEDVWPSSPSAYLKAVQEPAESGCRIAPGARWRVRLAKKSLAICFQRAGWLKPGDKLESIQVIRQDGSGRIQELLIHAHKPVKVTVGRFRNVVNQYYKDELIKSALFTISSEGESFAFKGRGWGHGVGLCQEGAMWMARHGKTYLQILQNYFPHTQISQLNS